MQTSNVDSLEILSVEQNGQHVRFGTEFINRFGDLTVPHIVTPDEGGPSMRIRQSLLTDPAGFRVPNAGCLAVFEQKLRKPRIQLRVDALPGIAHLPQPENVCGLNYPSVVDFLYWHRNGIIQLPNDLRANIIREIAVAFPRARIILTGARKATLENLSNQVINRLPERMRGEVVVVHGKKPLHVREGQPIPRIIFTTFISAADCDFETCDIVLLLDGRQVRHKRNRIALEARDARFRLFGFVETGAPVSPYESGLMMGTFGPQKIHLLSHGRVRRDVSVDIIENHQPKIYLTEDRPDFLRKCYWHNERRNRTIIQQARKLLGFSNCSAVTILVKHLDHAAALARKLRDWKIYVSPADRHAVNRMNREFRDRVAESDSASWSTGRCQIVMVNAVGQFRGYLSRAIIWASGGPVDEIPEHWFYGSDVDGDSNLRTLVVDFQDRFNPVTRLWSKRRLKAYKSRDIFPLGTAPAEGRIDAFLEGQREAANA